MFQIDGCSVTIMVSDLDRSAAFYVDVLGFDVLYRADPHFAMLRRGAFQLGLHPGAAPSGSPRSGDLTIGLSVPDIRAAVATLEAAGVTFPLGIVDDDGAILRAGFVDPDGTGLYLVQQVKPSEG